VQRRKKSEKACIARDSFSKRAKVLKRRKKRRETEDRDMKLRRVNLTHAVYDMQRENAGVFHAMASAFAVYAVEEPLPPRQPSRDVPFINLPEDSGS